MNPTYQVSDLHGFCYVYLLRSHGNTKNLNAALRVDPEGAKKLIFLGSAFVLARVAFATD